MNEEEKSGLMREGQMLEEKLKYLGKELERLSVVLVELEKARASIEGVGNGNTALLSIGGEILIETKITSEKLVFPIGAGYYKKISKEDAKEKINKVVGKINDSYKKIKEEVKTSETQLINLLRKVQGY